MTLVQKTIRTTVQRDGAMNINVGTGSPCNMGSIKALRRAGFTCTAIGTNRAMTVYRITN